MQQVKVLALSLQWRGPWMEKGFNNGHKNSHVPWVKQKKKKKKKKEEEEKKKEN